MDKPIEYTSPIPKAAQYAEDILAGKITLPSLQGQVPESWIQETKKILESKGYLIVEDSPDMAQGSIEQPDLSTEEIHSQLETAKQEFIDETDRVVEQSLHIGVTLPESVIQEAKQEVGFDEQISELKQEAGKEFTLAEGLKGFLDQKVKNITEISRLPLELLSQEEFAYWLQNNRDVLESETRTVKSMAGTDTQVHSYQQGYYNILTIRPELRKRMIAQQGIMEDASFDEARTYYKTIMQEEGKYENSNSNPDWFELSFGNTVNTETDGMRRKAYITISPQSLDIFKGSVAELIKKLNDVLKGNYNGSFKIAQKLTTLTNQFDNIVIHGANEQEVDKALEIIHKVLSENSIINTIAQKGKDGIGTNGKKTSHTTLLADKIKAGEIRLEKQL